MDEFDFDEVRNLLSVFNDQLEKFSIKLPQLTSEMIEDYTQKIKDGLVLVEGQVIFLKSTDNVNMLGMMPAIVTDLTRYSSTGLEYTLTLLTGDLNGELVTVKIDSSKLEDAVSVSEDMTNVIAAIKSTKLGSETFIALKQQLGITRFYVLDTDKFNSFI